MLKVMIVCPVTERRVPTGLEVEPGTRSRRSLPESGTLHCHACHRTHSWYRAETLFDGVIERRHDDPATKQTAPRIRYTLRQDDLGPSSGLAALPSPTLTRVAV